MDHCHPPHQIGRSYARSDIGFNEPVGHAGASHPDIRQTGAKPLIVIDPAVHEYQHLLIDLPPEAEVFVLPFGAGLADLGRAVAGQRDLSSIHLISHGSAGRIRIGETDLTCANLNEAQAGLRDWGAALKDGGDILIYGCEVGKGDGRALMSGIAKITGANIAASDTLTGAKALGGDWTLGIRHGQVTTEIVVSDAAQAAFVSVLPTFDFGSGATDNGDNVTQTVEGVTVTVTNTAGGMGIYDGGLGSGNVVSPDNDSTTATVISFSAPVNIASLYAAFGQGDFTTKVDYAVTDSSGNGAVQQSADDWVNGSVVTLDWTGVTSFQITSDSGNSIMPILDTIVFSIPAANTAPELGGTPADDTATEDVATAIDLSAYNLSDADPGDTITLTLAVDRGTIASTDGNGATGSGVTIATSGTASMTLVGAADALNTYLDDLSKITYTTALNDTTTAVLTVTPNDGTVDGVADTVNISITPVNDNPTVSSLPSVVTVTEDAQSNVDLGATILADVDGDPLTVTLTASAGTFAAPVDRAGVTETLVNDTTITLVGAVSDLNTYLDAPSNIQYTSAANVSGNNAATITVTANDGAGSGDVNLGTVNLNISGVNDDPTAPTIPTTVTVAEDTQSNVDLSTASFADVDSATITVTLTASAGTFATPADGATTGTGVTETLVDATTITLAGAPNDISTYLDTVSNIQYTPAANVSGNAAATITVTANDGEGSGNVNLGTVNVNVTPENDNPTVSALPSAVTVTEDAQSNVDLGATILADVDGDPLTVTLTASAGTFATPVDRAGVTETLVNDTTITLVGAVSDLNTYLDAPSNIQYTSAADVSGNNAATITVTANDGAGSGDVNLGTVNLNISGVNDAPQFSNLDGSPAFTEGGPAQILDADVTIADAELDARNAGNGDYDGASLVLARDGGVHASDAFSLQSGGNLTVAGSNMSANGNVFATFDTSSVPGQLTVNFTNANGTTPTTALVAEVMQAIRYANTSDDPSASAQIRWTFSDGNSGSAQGSGGNPGTGTGSTTVAITNINDAPTLTATGGNPTFAEGGGAQDIFNTVTASTIESADRFTSLTLTVTNVSDGASEILAFDGSDIALTDGNAVTTTTNGLSATVSVAGTTATVSFSGATLTNAQVATLVDALTYRNTSDTPTTTGNRVVTVTQISDNGGTTNGGVETTAPNLTSTVTVSAVNDPPNLTDFGPDAGNVAYTSGSSTFVALDAGTAANLEDAELDALESGVGNYNGATITLARTGATDTTDRFGIAGGTTALDNGSTVTVGATDIGTVTAGSAASGTLTITLNGNATSALVDTFFQSIGYANTNASATGTVTIDVTVNDGNSGSQGSGGARSVTEQVNVTFSARPEIGDLNGDTVAFTEDGGAVLVDQNGDATITDADLPADLDGGNLRVSVTGNATPTEDSLGLSSAGGFVSLGGTTAGSSVSVDLDGGGDGFVTIGTLENALAAGNPLQINFNANATTAHAQTLLRHTTYDNSSDTPTTDDRTISSVFTDETGLSSAAATSIVTVAAVNDNPTATGIPAELTVPEDVLSDIDLSAASFADPDSTEITVTLTLSEGTFAAPADGGAVGSGVTATLVDPKTITLVGASADITTYLDTASNIQYTPAANVNGLAAATLSITGNDGAGAGEVNLSSVTLNVTAVNDVPELANLGNTTAFTIGGAARALAAGVTVADVELGARNGGDGDFDGASVILSRDSGANANDIFSIQDGGNLTISGGDISAGGNVFATFDTASVAGQITIQFTKANGTTPTTDLVSEVMQAILYDNTVDGAGTTVPIRWAFSDGNAADAQGTGDNPGETTGLTTVAFGTPGGGGGGGGGGSGGSGGDSLTGSTSVDDVLTGGGANDTISGLAGNDTLTGGDGDDLVRGGNGRDVADLGPGDDSYFDTAQTGPNAADSVNGGTGDDTIRGGGGADTLKGGNGTDSINGGKGADEIRGGKGADTLNGGGGNDTVNGGNGNDLANLGAGNDRYTDTAQETANDHDEVNGQAGNDTINGGCGRDTLTGGTGEDVVMGACGSDLIRGGADADTVMGGRGSDTVDGGDGSDLIQGGRGNDILNGGNDNDTLFGGLGSDAMDGGDGSDRLLSGAGNDTITGGAGSDTFVFKDQTAIDGQVDTVTDFESGVDQIEMRGLVFSDLTITDGSTGAEIVLDGYTIVLEGVSAASLSEGDFVFL